MIGLQELLSWLNKNKMLLFQILILISCILIPSFILKPPGKPRIIASLISLNLNGLSKEDIQAQILIENSTSHEMEENEELLNLVKQDLIFLANQIEGLESLTIYDYKLSPLPGRLDMFLENIRFRDKEYLREINRIIRSDNIRWWYVENLIFTPIEETYRHPFCSGSGISIYPMFYEPIDSYDDNVTLLRNETLIASWWIAENGNWTFNEEFYQVIVNDILPLKDKISGIEDIYISDYNGYENSYIRDLYINETEINQLYPIIYNLSEPIPNHYAYEFGELPLAVTFSSTISRTERNAVLKVFDKIILSKWYMVTYYWLGPCEFGDDFFILALGWFIALPISIVVFTIVIYRIVKKIFKNNTSNI